MRTASHLRPTAHPGEQVIRHAAPHPRGGAVVGPDVQPYEPPRSHRPFREHGRGPGLGIPAMRPSHDGPANNASSTPIYDALYAEYSRLFRTLPGDRTGEEKLRFEGFGLGFGTVHGTGTGNWGAGNRGSDDWRSDDWPRDALPRRGGHVPAALPPGARDGQAY